MKPGVSPVTKRYMRYKLTILGCIFKIPKCWYIFLCCRCQCPLSTSTPSTSLLSTLCQFAKPHSSRLSFPVPRTRSWSQACEAEQPRTLAHKSQTRCSERQAAEPATRTRRGEFSKRGSARQHVWPPAIPLSDVDSLTGVVQISTSQIP